MKTPPRFAAVRDMAHHSHWWRVIDLRTMTWTSSPSLSGWTARTEARRRNRIDRQHPDREVDAWPDMLDR